MGEELKNRKRKNSKKIVAENNKPQDVDDKLLKKKKRKSTETAVENGGEIVSTTNSDVKKRRPTKKAGTKISATKSEVTKRKAKSEGDKEADTKRSSRTGKSKKVAKKKKRSELPTNDVPQDILPEKQEVVVEDEVYEMSSGDEDESKGMKKWIMQYHQSRPGIKVLQEKIDDFIMEQEAQAEQARKERYDQAAEGGFEVVVQKKGRKKTTENETGTSVGCVSEAAVLEQMSKKKNKTVGLDFYRFQKREAHRTELMNLQSKFQQDKQRIQQMRAERKFRPY